MSTDAERIIELYERHAHAWDSDRGSDIVVETVWLDRFLGLLPPGAAVLDLGCGSGQPLARHLIARKSQVVGVDSSATLIALCRQRFPEHEWLIADMRTLAINRPFQGILAWDSFFHLSHEHQRRMFAIFQAHACAGTALLFTSGPRHGEALGSYQGERLYHASLAPEEYRGLLSSHGFDLVCHQAEDPLCGLHTVWLAAAVAKNSDHIADQGVAADHSDRPCAG
jgi:SAM-dependent methyltransferase